MISDPIAGPWGWFGLSKQGNLCYGAFKSIGFTRNCEMWHLESIGMMTTIISDPIAGLGVDLDFPNWEICVMELLKTEFTRKYDMWWFGFLSDLNRATETNHLQAASTKSMCTAVSQSINFKFWSFGSFQKFVCGF